MLIIIFLIVYNLFFKPVESKKKDYIQNFEGTITFHYERSIIEDDEVIIKDKNGMNIQSVEINFAQTRYSIPPVDGDLFLYIKKVPFDIFVVGGSVQYHTQNYMKLLPQDPKNILIYIKDTQ
tara:strand:- start:268 stop:633 length:366 start_codon:yes stop_codon:yes gene_type:complete